MSAPPSKPSQPSATTFNERLNEQLVNCLNVQTNVIQNLSQYSQHISIQLIEIKSIVEILSNRVLALQQQQQQQSHFPPSHYAASYYPNYMSPHPSQIPVSHPLPTSHPQSVPLSVQQPSAHIRVPNPSAMPTNPNLPFYSPNITNPPPPPQQQQHHHPQPPPPSSITNQQPPPSSTNQQPFQFFPSTGVPPSSSSSQTTVPTTFPPATQTTPTKSIFSNIPKFGTNDTTANKPQQPPSSTSSFFQTSTTNEKPSTNSIFSFGTNNASSSFGVGGLASGLPTLPAPKQENHADDNGEDDGEDDSYEPNVSFKPIVQLSAVEVKTGEEDENVLFCERGKLYRFDSATNQMKERGIGEMKILQHKTTKVCRILMRREQVLKICANHSINSQMELKPHQGSSNAYLWSAMDFADGEAKHETLCIRFKTEEQAKNFAKVFNEAKEMNSKKSGDSPSVGKVSSNDETKAKSTTSSDDDVIALDEIKPSAEQVDRAEKLQLPSTFFLYENKEPCKGCAGCKEDTPPLAPNENKTTTTTKKSIDIPKPDVKPSTPQTPSTTSGPKTPLSSSENIKFSFVNNNNTDKPQLQKQTSTTKDEKVSVESPSSATNATSQYDNKPSIFGSFNGNSSQSIFGGTTPLNNSNGSVFGGSASFKPANNTNNGFSFPGFGGVPSTPSSGFQFSTPSAQPAATSTTNNNTSSTFSFGTGAGSSTNQPVFGNTPKFSFADVAKQTSNNDKSTSNGTEQRVFAGQGSLIFGTNSANTTITTTTNNDDDEGEGGGEDDSYEPNVSFKPIVQLSAVEVKTGEEDENVLFCERGKLYRFDSATNQMKERGIGEMKILQHKTTKVCRILMRREQVLKICANHSINSQMELKPHQGSENAFVWSAMDFADGEAKHETLCIRFKSADLANKFVKQFNEAKQANANVQQ